MSEKLAGAVRALIAHRDDPANCQWPMHGEPALRAALAAWDAREAEERDRAQQLAELVKRMRDHQDAYFRSRDKRDLHRAKDLEYQVDAEVIRILDTRPRLFGDEAGTPDR